MRIWYKVGEVAGFEILRQKEFPAFCMDPKTNCIEAHRPIIVKLCNSLEKEALTMAQAKVFISLLNEFILSLNNNSK